MRLPFLRPKSDAGGAERPASGSGEAGALQQARTQARRRLIGALVLLVAAVVGFPLVFETQPRPLPGAVPIENGPLVVRDATPAPAVAAAARETARAGAASSALAAPDTQAAIAASAPPLPAKAVVAPTATTAATTASTTTAAAPAAPGSAAVVAKPVAKAASAAGAAPALALTKPAAATTKPGQPDKAEKTAAKPPAAPASSAAAPKTTDTTAPDAAARWVVQVGAYNDMERMRQARQKAEKLGFKTYTTEVDTPTGRRTRVRLGPFATQKEAEAAAVKVKAAGMAANVLNL